MVADDLQGVADMYKAMTTRGIQPDICTFVALFKVADFGYYLCFHLRLRCIPYAAS